MSTLLGEAHLNTGQLLAALEPYEAERGLIITKDGEVLLVPLTLLGGDTDGHAMLVSSVSLFTKAIKVTDVRQRLMEMRADLPFYVGLHYRVEQFPLVVTAVGMRRNLVALECEVGWGE